MATKGNKYLEMIADIGISESPSHVIDAKRVRSPPLITPASILASSRYGLLTRGGLRDAFRFATGCSVEDAYLCIDVAVEAGIVIVDEHGHYRVRQ